MEGGKLPSLARLKESGMWGYLESTFPPKTIPAWPVMVTGRNPGKLGLFHFLNRAEPNRVDRFVAFNSSMVEGQAFWDYLGRAGYQVGVVNFPLLYPPYPVNGFMVSGMGASESREITYPSSLRRELDEVTGGYEIRVPYADPHYVGNEDLLIADLTRVLEKRTKAIKHLMESRDWDLLFAIFSVTDWVQHYFWKHIDPTHRLYDGAESESFRGTFEGFWMVVDRAVGEIVGQVDDETTILILSDHGFGPVDQQFRVNAWLREKGYLVSSSNQNISQYLRRFAFPILKKVGGPVVRRLPGLDPSARRIGKRLSPSIIAQIDLEKSDAFMPKQYSNVGTIYITHPSGSEAHLRVKERLMRDLANIGVDLDLPIEARVYEPERLYWGEKAVLAPDVLFTLNELRCGVNPDLSGPLFEPVPGSDSKTGMHRMEGILIARGPGISCGQIEGAKLVDIAPTVLYFFDHPLFKDMDGSVLHALFLESFNQERDVELVETKDALVSHGLSKEDEALVCTRLEELGYL